LGIDEGVLSSGHWVLRKEATVETEAHFLSFRRKEKSGSLKHKRQILREAQNDTAL